jgi:hypothetical protein
MCVIQDFSEAAMTRALLFMLALAKILWPLEAHSNSIAVSGPQLDPSAPSLPANPTEAQRLDFAFRSYQWLKEYHPIDTFKPAPVGQMTSAEWQAKEALAAIAPVKDGPDDIASQEWHDHERDIAYSLVKDIVRMESGGFTEFLKSAPAGDMGNGAWRDSLMTHLAEQSSGYSRVTAAHDVLHTPYRYPNEFPPKGPMMKTEFQPVTREDSEAFLKSLEQAEESRRAIKAAFDKHQASFATQVARYDELLPRARDQLARAQAADAARRKPNHGFDPIGDILGVIPNVLANGRLQYPITGGQQGQDTENRPGPWLPPENKGPGPWQPPPPVVELQTVRPANNPEVKIEPQR